MDKTKKLILAVVALGLVVLVVWTIFRTSPVSVETGTAERGRMLATVDGEGVTRCRDKFIVTAPITGRMARITIREGDLIPKEYVITAIDPNPQATMPPSETEDHPNTLAQKVYAPAAGRLLRIIEKNDRIVTAGTPLVEIGNPEKIEIVVDVLSTEAAKLRPGAVMLVDHPGAAEPIRARVRTIEPQAFTKISALGVEEQRVNIVADFQTSELRFGDNFRVDVRIIAWEGDNILRVPSSALFRVGEDWNVFVVQNGRAYRRKIVAGHQTAAETEILQGLNEKEIVVLHPPNQLTEGAKVKNQ